MEHMKEKKESGKQQQGSRQLIYEDFQPSIEWTQDPMSHILHIDLPGFKIKDLTVQVDSSGKLVVKGERQMTEIKHIRLEKAFDVPKDSDIDKVSGKLEDGRLFLIIPRKVTTGEKKKPISEEKPKKGEEDSKKDTSSLMKEDQKLKKKGEGDGEKEEQGQAIKEEKEDWLKRMGKELGLLESGLVDTILDKVNKNKKVIVVAVAAFSIGFCVSQKLRSRGQ